MAQWILKTLFRIVLAMIARQETEGLDRVPEPPYILTINHIGTFDVVFGYAHLGGEHIVGWAAEKYETHPIFGPLLRAGGSIFIQRGKVDRAALNAGVQALKAGKSFALAPEGTRSPNAALARAKTGMAYLAAESGVPVIPIALTGTENVIPTLKRLQRPLLTMRVAEAVHLPDVPPEGRNAALRANTDQIMCRIAAMLPPSYRGYYAEHPLTLALLERGYDRHPVEANAPAPT